MAPLKAFLTKYELDRLDVFSMTTVSICDLRFLDSETMEKSSELNEKSENDIFFHIIHQIKVNWVPL